MKYIKSGDALWVVGQTEELSRKLERLSDFELLRDITEDTLFDTYKAALLNNRVVELFINFS
jgi:hypothetical protein